MPGIDQRFRHYSQFQSRLGFSHHYRALGRNELLFVLDRHWKRLGKTLDPDDFTNAQAMAAIERINRGNFRLLERLFPQIARVLNVNQLEAITDDVIEAAASILIIGNERHEAITELRQRASKSTAVGGQGWPAPLTAVFGGRRAISFRVAGRQFSKWRCARHDVSRQEALFHGS